MAIIIPVTVMQAILLNSIIVLLFVCCESEDQVNDGTLWCGALLCPHYFDTPKDSVSFGIIAHTWHVSCYPLHDLPKIAILPDDSVAEWLRRWIANPLLFERAGSNPAAVGLIFASTYTEKARMICTTHSLSIYFPSTLSYSGGIMGFNPHSMLQGFDSPLFLERNKWPHLLHTPHGMVACGQ